MYWPKLTNQEIKTQVFDALNKNVNYRKTPILGIPATYLDAEVFYPDAPFLANAPFLSTLIDNPNHIGCHTLNGGVDIFSGTQEMEIDLINLCAEQIFKGEANAADGYVTSGGTEANIEALWIYRNYFMKEHAAKTNEIAVIYSADSHYSLSKGVNLLNLTSLVIPVNEQTREMELADLKNQLQQAQLQGIKYFIVNLNLSTTMFGSVDDIEQITALLNQSNICYKLHVDAAFGGFIYPFTNPESAYTFQNPNITSFSTDAHKMLQTPYGTGIFLIRKGYLKYVQTEEAQYIPGTDHTLCGSRSGANAISIWMVLHNHGSAGWAAKMQSLLTLTSDVCSKLTEMGIRHYRNPYINIITIPASDIPATVATKYHLVADSYQHEAKWWKIVVMPHITRGVLDGFFNELTAELSLQNNTKTIVP